MWRSGYPALQLLLVWGITIAIMAGRLVLTLLRHPSVWWEGLRTAREIRCKEWLSSLLFVPEQEYLQWRVMTAYGQPDADPDPDDVLRYLRWRRRQRVREK